MSRSSSSSAVPGIVMERSSATVLLIELRPTGQRDVPEHPLAPDEGIGEDDVRHGAEGHGGLELLAVRLREEHGAGVGAQQ